MKILVATEKPFAPVAVKGIRDVVEAAGHELVLLEKGTKEDLKAAVADANGLIVRSRMRDEHPWAKFQCCCRACFWHACDDVPQLL